jgi:hypothetical protein
MRVFHIPFWNGVEIKAAKEDFSYEDDVLVGLSIAGNMTPDWIGWKTLR